MNLNKLLDTQVGTPELKIPPGTKTTPSEQRARVVVVDDFSPLTNVTAATATPKMPPLPSPPPPPPQQQSQLISEPAEKEMQPQRAVSIPSTSLKEKSSLRAKDRTRNSPDEFYYYYSSWEKCYEIFGKKCINTEKLFHERTLVEGIVLLSLPPSSSDNELLLEYFGPNVPVDKKQVECCIRLRREILDEHKKYLAQIGPNKYLCKRKIQFSSRLPKHEFRTKYFS